MEIIIANNCKDTKKVYDDDLYDFAFSTVFFNSVLCFICIMYYLLKLCINTIEKKEKKEPTEWTHLLFKDLHEDLNL